MIGEMSVGGGKKIKGVIGVERVSKETGTEKRVSKETGTKTWPEFTGRGEQFRILKEVHYINYCQGVKSMLSDRGSGDLRQYLNSHFSERYGGADSGH